MTFSKLLLYIALTILGFWLLGFAIELAAWAIYIVMLIVAILFIVWLVQQWYNDYQIRTTTKTKTATAKKPAQPKAKTVKTVASKVAPKPRRKTVPSTKKTTTKPKKKSTK